METSKEIHLECYELSLSVFVYCVLVILVVIGLGIWLDVAPTMSAALSSVLGMATVFWLRQKQTMIRICDGEVSSNCPSYGGICELDQISKVSVVWQVGDEGDSHGIQLWLRPPNEKAAPSHQLFVAGTRDDMLKAALFINKELFEHRRSLNLSNTGDTHGPPLTFGSRTPGPRRSRRKP